MKDPLMTLDPGNLFHVGFVVLTSMQPWPR